MESLLWPTLQPIRSHRNWVYRPVRYNLMHTNTKWRLHSRLPTTVSDCSSPTSPVSYPTVTLWHVSSKSLIGQTTKEVLLSLKALSTVWGLPSCTDIHILNIKCKRCWYDEMKLIAWFICKNIYGFLFMLYCKLFSSCIDIKNGAVLDGKFITTNINHAMFFISLLLHLKFL